MAHESLIGDELSSIDPPFSDNHVGHDVPGTGFDPRDALTIVGDSDQTGTSPSATLSKIGEGPIIEAATHADAMTVGVESNEWHQQEIEIPR
jgi:hypothetical protein